ncbi:SID1 transmembrane member 1 [Clonorchis sinensis]|uniref:SID1 transmembrane member 1 n=1 Tax=Clonorchis sinensis TaxID=79923 RepID=A0A8T1MWS1_CLOSI|nr:SID1 transmembrane member 1 [Clonorchis sinensis]
MINTVLLVCLLTTVQARNASLDVDNEGNISITQGESFDFRVFNVSSQELVVRIHVESEDASKDYPLLVVVKQRNEVTSFRVPTVVNELSLYNNVSRTLCPLKLSSDFSVNFTVELSTFSLKNVSFKFRAESVTDFDLGKDDPLNFLLRPAQPVYFRYRFTHPLDSVAVKVVSPDNVCMVLSLQTMQCPVSDGPDTVQNAGLYQTVTNLGVISANELQYPDGFYVVLVLKATDFACTGMERLLPIPTAHFQRHREPNRQNKNVTLKILPAPSRWDYIIPISGAFGFFALFYLAGMIIICTSRYLPHGHERTVDLSEETEAFCQPTDVVRNYGTATHITTTHPSLHTDSSLVDMLDTEESESRSLKPPKPLCTQRARRGNGSQGGDSRSRTSTIQPLPSTSHHADVPLSVPRGENSLGGSNTSLNHSRTLIMEHTREHHGWFSSSDEDQPEGQFVGAQDTLDKYPSRSPQVRASTPGSAIQHEVSETRPITELRRPNHSPTSTGTSQTSAPDKQAHSERGSREVLTNAERNTDGVTVLLSQNDMFRIVPVSSLSRKRYTTLNRKYLLYFWYLIIISIFYGLPAIQLIMIYQKTLVETGNEDLCYYNFECARPLGIFTAFNNIISNIGYIMLGLLFLTATARRDLIHRRRRKLDPEVTETRGLPQHYGLYYAMGLALTMEGIMSACYHMCPSFSNFQFDTAYMYILAMLIILKIYQTRHPDVNASAHSAYMVMAVVIFLGVTGVVYGSQTFWIAFTILFLLMSVVLTGEIYYMGQWNIDYCLPRRLYSMIKSDGIRCLRPMYLERMILLLVANLVNFALAGYGVATRPRDFSSFLLSVFMINMMVYTLFYIFMKLRHKERILLAPILYMVAGLVCWSAAIYFFFLRNTTWEVTPAQSRALNHPCLLFDFYDAHDIWHFLSASSMFFSFMMLMNLDDDLVDRPRDQIAVF